MKVSYFFIVFTLYALITLPLPVYAASADSQSEDSAGANQDSTTTADSPSASNQSDTKGSKDQPTKKPPLAATKGEVFIPTEAISEDYNVSFPADI